LNFQNSHYSSIYFRNLRRPTKFYYELHKETQKKNFGWILRTHGSDLANIDPSLEWRCKQRWPPGLEHVNFPVFCSPTLQHAVTKLIRKFVTGTVLVLFFLLIIDSGH
jgi:hypothetical protein